MRQKDGDGDRQRGERRVGAPSARGRPDAQDARSTGEPGVVDGVPDYEEAMSQLERCAQSLESGQLPLDESLRVFEQGMRLAQLCQTLLDHADLVVRRLVPSEGGEYTIETLEIDVDR
jgi:exodeoxyribonuclease VII small subunit